MIPLTEMQYNIMDKFYSIRPTQVILDKKCRSKLWNKTKSGEKIDIESIRSYCPSLAHQINRSYSSEENKNIQSAVFSECIYAQTFANMLNLDVFYNCYEDSSVLGDRVLSLLRSYGLVPRYAYTDSEQREILIQAGGNGGVDSALIIVKNFNIYTIEFKEPYSKTSEPDLPKYGEDGKINITNEFILNNPQFEAMVKERGDINFFDIMGHNVNFFSPDSINLAVSGNYSYSKKYADVICTEDKNGYLSMIPANQVNLWSKMEGEIRPAGRNNYSVWTPNFLQKYLVDIGAKINGRLVVISKSCLTVRRERGGGGKISGYKINPLFFVRSKDIDIKGEDIYFSLDSVRQLRPTIAAKMSFKDLDHCELKEYYIDKNKN